MISIRPAAQVHVAQLVAIDAIAAHSEERRAAIAGWVDFGQAHVALDAGRVVGYAALTRNFFHSPFLEMVMVALSERRRGIGIGLTRHCLELCAGEAKVWASTNASNAAMRTLLAEAGFATSGVIDNLDDGDPELVFLWRRAS